MQGNIVDDRYVRDLDADPGVKLIAYHEGWTEYRCCGEEITVDHLGPNRHRITTRQIPI